MKTTSHLVQLGPFDQLRAGKLTRRLPQLILGLFFYGISTALMVRGNLGQAPWDALHLGITARIHISFGWVVIGLSFIVLLLWIPLREIPGVGTIANAIIIGAVASATLQILRTPDLLWERFALTSGGVFLCGLGSALYIGAQLGRGPRDGLMTGLSRVTGLSLRVVRTGLEITILVFGLMLGGFELFGVGTVMFTILIGPLTQGFLPWVMVSVDTMHISTTEN